MQMVKHGAHSIVRPASAPISGVTFHVRDPGSPGSRPSRGSLVMELAVMYDSSPDHLVSVSVRYGSQVESREFCVGPRQEEDAIYCTATPAAVVRKVKQMLNAIGIQQYPPSFLDEALAAAVDACAEWNSLSATILAERLVSMSGLQARDILDETIVSTVLTS